MHIARLSNKFRMHLTGVHCRFSGRCGMVECFHGIAHMKRRMNCHYREHWRTVSRRYIGYAKFPSVVINLFFTGFHEIRSFLQVIYGHERHPNDSGASQMRYEKIHHYKEGRNGFNTTFVSVLGRTIGSTSDRRRPMWFRNVFRCYYKLVTAPLSDMVQVPPKGNCLQTLSYRTVACCTAVITQNDHKNRRYEIIYS